MSNELTKTFYVQYYLGATSLEEIINSFFKKRNCYPDTILANKNIIAGADLEKFYKIFPNIAVIENNTIQPGNIWVGPVEKKKVNYA